MPLPLFVLSQFFGICIYLNYPNENFEEMEPENIEYFDDDPPCDINGPDYRLEFIIRQFTN